LEYSISFPVISLLESSDISSVVVASVCCNVNVVSTLCPGNSSLYRTEFGAAFSICCSFLFGI